MEVRESEIEDTQSEAPSGSEDDSSGRESLAANELEGESETGDENELKSKNEEYDNLIGESGIFPSGRIDVNRLRKRKSDYGSRLETSTSFSFRRRITSMNRVNGRIHPLYGFGNPPWRLRSHAEKLACLRFS